MSKASTAVCFVMNCLVISGESFLWLKGLKSLIYFRSQGFLLICVVLCMEREGNRQRGLTSYIHLKFPPRHLQPSAIFRVGHPCQAAQFTPGPHPTSLALAEAGHLSLQLQWSESQENIFTHMKTSLFFSILRNTC